MAMISQADLPTAALTLKISPRQLTAMQRRAGEAGLQPSAYAKLLFDAAFTARVMDERGEDSGDAALDRLVKQAFLMADCEPDAIAATLGCPERWVRKIIDGWREVAKPKPVMVVQEIPPKPAAPAATAKPAFARYSDTDILTIKKMWAENASVDAIANALGRDRGGVKTWIYTHPGVCPKRQGG